LPVDGAGTADPDPGPGSRRERTRQTFDRAALAEPTEVHVTIGRIEVTAMHAPAPPPRKAPDTRAPMSLDEYLARRQKGGA
jgi:hypothetical protein